MNLRIITAAAKKFGMPMERVIVTVESSVSISLALDHAIQEGNIQRGDTLLFAEFGGDLTWGSTLVKY